MNKTLILTLADPRATLESCGGKGESLSRLVRAGLPVPGGFHITTAAYRQFLETNRLQPEILAILEALDLTQPAALQQGSQRITDLFLSATIPMDIAGAIAQAYGSLTGQNPAVAVRSSATAEDLPGLSFAGQQETYLNIQGAEALLAAVRNCWASLWTARAIGYRARNGIDQAAVSLAVVVQALVPAEAAGILFTANPLTGERDQVVISAAWGLGEAVVGGLVTPDNLIVEKASGKVIDRQTSRKQVMTVRVDGSTETQPVPDELQCAPVLSDQDAAELAHLGAQIESLYGMPVDIEWAMLDGKKFILQARPITTLEKAAPRPAGEVQWRGPKPRIRYLRNNIVELMPDPLTPLFTTFGRRIISRSLKQYMAAFGIQSELLPQELFITINGYAYYNGDFNFRYMGSLLLDSVGIMRRMFTGMEERWKVARLSYAEIVARRRAWSYSDRSAMEILAGAEEIMRAAVDYYAAIVSGLIPAAWMREGLFTAVYNRLIKRKNDPLPAVFLLGYDSKPLEGEKALYDLARWTRTRPALAALLEDTPTQNLLKWFHDPIQPAAGSPEDWEEWRLRFLSYLERFGATIYDLDFAKPTPADDPLPLLETFKLFLKGQGTNPYERQEAATRRREQAVAAIRARLVKGFRLAWFNKHLAQAQHLVPLREDGLADIGLGYPLLRQMLLEVGSRLQMAGGIEQPGDVFWIEEVELTQAARALDQNERVEPLAGVIQERKDTWQAQKQLTPPFSLPQRPKLRRSRKASDGEIITGVPCSPGRVTGTARVMHGPEDFAQMQPGDILVAGITTPAWTPLFAMASAIVTDIGGPLSHGSIVAREYGIPAILGTGVATKRITSGQTITVDGALGTVTLPEHGNGRKLG